MKRGNTTGSLTKILTGLLAYELYEIRVGLHNADSLTEGITGI